MKLALECPTELLELVQPFADFDWILANKFLEDEAYATYYSTSENLKFVDNSVTELGEPCSLEDLSKVFEDVRGNYVISPDWINDYTKTVLAYNHCVEKFGPDATIGVLQGSTPYQALLCLDAYQGSLVAVPYRVGGSSKEDPSWLMTLRRLLVTAHIPTDRLIHLLGFTSIEELRWYTNRPNVIGIDTDVPIRSGLLGKDYDEFDRASDTSGIAVSQSNWAGICRNIALFRKHIS